MIHHVQNERGDLRMSDSTSPTYAQDDDPFKKNGNGSIFKREIYYFKRL